MQIKSFTFNPFSENTYVLFDETTKDCAIFDPGCSNFEEEEQLIHFISSNGLNPIHLLNTHCHIDHILGNRFISEKYNLPLQANSLDIYNIKSADQMAEMWGMKPPLSPLPEVDLKEGMVIRIGNTSLNILFTPGHCLGHIVFYAEEEKFIIGGDVLFRESIGRTDLPGGDFETLVKSITEKIYTLPNDVTVYSGHGIPTTIGHEKRYNPFIKSEYEV